MLTKLLIENAKPGTKPRRLSDGRGMYLEIAPSGGKWWRFKYRMAGKERRVSLGVYPDIGLAEARERREQARKHVAAGLDPGQKRRAEKVALVERTENTFAALAQEWFGLFSPKWVESHASKVSGRLENDLVPWLGTRGSRSEPRPRRRLGAAVRGPSAVDHRTQSGGRLDARHRPLSRYVRNPLCVAARTAGVHAIRRAAQSRVGGI